MTDALALAPDVSTPGSLRVIPTDWVHPLDLPRDFGRPPVPLEVDVGCGKGRFLLARATARPDTCFLGIDRRPSRLARVERKAVRRALTNVRLLFADACYAVSYLLPPSSVSVYYLFFPDPWPKRRHHRRRLFDPAFLDAMSRTLTPGGIVNVATDHHDYFAAIQAALAADGRFEQAPPFIPREEERTDFEVIFMGQARPIGRASFRKVGVTTGCPEAVSSGQWAVSSGQLE